MVKLKFKKQNNIYTKQKKKNNKKSYIYKILQINKNKRTKDIICQQEVSITIFNTNSISNKNKNNIQITKYKQIN